MMAALEPCNHQSWPEGCSRYAGLSETDSEDAAKHEREECQSIDVSMVSVGSGAYKKSSAVCGRKQC
jgi:hypothetical protein